MEPPPGTDESCAGAAAALLVSGEAEAFGVAQTAALSECDGKRELLVYAIVTFNIYQAQLEAARQREYCLETKPWWQPWRRC